MRSLRLLLPALVLGVPSLAHATGGTDAAAAAEAGGNGQGAVVTVVGVLVVGLAYTFADTIVDKLQRRFLVLSGVEYFLLGFMIGPESMVHVLEDLDGLLPLIALAAGWVGLLRGTEFDARGLGQTRRTTWLVVLLHHLIPSAMVAAAAYYVALAGYLGPVDPRAAGVSAAVLGCCAAADSAAPFDLLGKRYVIRGGISPLLRRAARFGDVFVIMMFSVVFAVFHGSSTHTDQAAEWWLITIFLGVVLGFTFQSFLGGDESENSRFLALVGIITFASGAAYFLRLSPLAVNVVLGIILVNFSKGGAAIRKTLESTEKPMELVLMVLAGALWRPTPWLPTLLGFVGFVTLRVVGKSLGSWVAARGTDLRRDLYRGLMAHGEVTVAMAVSFKLVYERVFTDSVVVDLAYSIVLLSIIAHNLVSPRMLRALLVDAGDLDRERPASATMPEEVDLATEGMTDVIPAGLGALPAPPRVPSSMAPSASDRADGANTGRPSDRNKH